MKRGLGLIGVLIAIIAVSGCDRNAFDPSAPVETVPQKTITVLEYRGQDLFCIEQMVAHGALTYTCDFAAFYAEPPKHGSKLGKTHVSLVTTPYRNHDLYCFEYDGGHGTVGYTCDFERFYKEYGSGPLPEPS